MRSTILISSMLFFSLSCDGGDLDDDGSGRDASTNDSSTTADSGTPDSGAPDMGVSTLECDPDFGQADACGGDLSGTWNYRVACGASPLGSAIQDACATAEIRVDRVEGGSGTLTVNGASFVLDVDIDVHVEAGIPATCTFNGCPGTQVVLQQALPQSTVVCATAAAGCDCTIDGPVASSSNGTVTTSGGVATVDGSDTYYYCVEGGSLIYRRFGTGANEPAYVLDE